MPSAPGSAGSSGSSHARPTPRLESARAPSRLTSEVRYAPRPLLIEEPPSARWCKGRFLLPSRGVSTALTGLRQQSTFDPGRLSAALSVAVCVQRSAPVDQVRRARCSMFPGPRRSRVTFWGAARTCARSLRYPSIVFGRSARSRSLRSIHSARYATSGVWPVAVTLPAYASLFQRRDLSRYARLGLCRDMPAVGPSRR